MSSGNKGGEEEKERKELHELKTKLGYRDMGKLQAKVPANFDSFDVTAENVTTFHIRSLRHLAGLPNDAILHFTAGPVEPGHLQFDRAAITLDDKIHVVRATNKMDQNKLTTDTQLTAQVSFAFLFHRDASGTTVQVATTISPGVTEIMESKSDWIWFKVVVEHFANDQNTLSWYEPFAYSNTVAKTRTKGWAVGVSVGAAGPAPAVAVGGGYSRQHQHTVVLRELRTDAYLRSLNSSKPFDGVLKATACDDSENLQNLALNLRSLPSRGQPCIDWIVQPARNKNPDGPGANLNLRTFDFGEAEIPNLMRTSYPLEFVSSWSCGDSEQFKPSFIFHICFCDRKKDKNVVRLTLRYDATVDISSKAALLSSVDVSLVPSAFVYMSNNLIKGKRQLPYYPFFEDEKEPDDSTLKKQQQTQQDRQDYERTHAACSSAAE
jgi:hypothetical protein